MIKKKHGLLICEYCNRPKILVNMDPIDDFMEGKSKEHQGPKTYPKVKSWCRGSCFLVVCPLILELDSLGTFINQAKEPKIKKFARYMLKRLRGVAKEQDTALREMAKDLP